MVGKRRAYNSGERSSRSMCRIVSLCFTRGIDRNGLDICSWFWNISRTSRLCWTRNWLRQSHLTSLRMEYTWSTLRLILSQVKRCTYSQRYFSQSTALLSLHSYAYLRVISLGNSRIEHSYHLVFSLESTCHCLWLLSSTLYLKQGLSLILSTFHVLFSSVITYLISLKMNTENNHKKWEGRK